MSKETIIFFDKLGFGWVLDNITAKELKLSYFNEENTVNKSLIKIIENLLDYDGCITWIWCIPFLCNPLYDCFSPEPGMISFVIIKQFLPVSV